ncbi:MAG: hypothetical protein ABR898_14490 [Terracidiphilus sp.]
MHAWSLASFNFFHRHRTTVVTEEFPVTPNDSNYFLVLGALVCQEDRVNY